MKINLYTIGFTQKTAEEFFRILVSNGIKKVVDIRLNTSNQLAGFTKHPDFEYFLKLHEIAYEHNLDFAPTKELFDKYKDKKNKMSFEEYTVEYKKILNIRQCVESERAKDLDKTCYLCSESKPHNCHRRLAVEAIKGDNQNINIIHL